MKLTSDRFTIPFSERLIPDYWNIIQAEIDRSSYSALYHNLLLHGSDSSEDNRTVVKDSQDWANNPLEIPSWLIAVYGLKFFVKSHGRWSLFQSALLLGRFVCCNSRFQIGLSTQRVWSVIKKWWNYDVLFRTYAIPQRSTLRAHCAVADLEFWKVGFQ